MFTHCFFFLKKKKEKKKEKIDLLGLSGIQNNKIENGLADQLVLVELQSIGLVE